MVPSWMHPGAGVARFSYIHNPKRWRQPADDIAIVQTIGKGQEIVMNVDDRGPVDDWLAGLFADVPTLEA